MRDFILSAYGGLSLRSLFHVHVFIHKCCIVNYFQLVADDLHCCEFIAHLMADTLQKYFYL